MKVEKTKQLSNHIEQAQDALVECDDQKLLPSQALVCLDGLVSAVMALQGEADPSILSGPSQVGEQCPECDTGKLEARTISAIGNIYISLFCADCKQNYPLNSPKLKGLVEYVLQVRIRKSNHLNPNEQQRLAERFKEGVIGTYLGNDVELVEVGQVEVLKEKDPDTSDTVGSRTAREIDKFLRESTVTLGDSFIRTIAHIIDRNAEEPYLEYVRRELHDIVGFSAPEAMPVKIERLMENISDELEG